MSDTKQLLNELLAHEPLFHLRNIVSCEEDFLRETAQDFWEVGASGTISELCNKLRRRRPGTYRGTDNPPAHHHGPRGHHNPTPRGSGPFSDVSEHQVERVTGIEPAFSAWEFASPCFRDQGKRSFCLVKRCFLVVPSPPNIGPSGSVVARRWHANVPWRFS
jgi:hypothetical protein